MDAREIASMLPWRPPFLMIDEFVECEPQKRIVTRKRVTANDPLAACQGLPVRLFPATLLLEGMGQSAALLFRISRPQDAADALPLLGFLSAALYGSASAGQSVLFEVRSVKMTATGGVFEAWARVGQEILAEAQLAFGVRQNGDDG